MLTKLICRETPVGNVTPPTLAEDRLLAGEILRIVAILALSGLAVAALRAL